MRILLIAGILLIASLPVFAQGPAAPYRLEFDPAQDVLEQAEYAGRRGWFITVRYAIVPDGVPEPGTVYKVIIEEEGQKRFELDVSRPKTTVLSEDLAVVLTMDTSGSMSEFGRMVQARKAADTFLKALPARADCGLILFNHLVYARVPPTLDRAPVKAQLDKAEPSGGTAYLDATAEAVANLQPFANKQRAVIVMTDGVDINSDQTQEAVIAKAVEAGVRVYTIGIGKKGTLEPVTTMLVLDKSGSMNLRANDRDKQTKIEALKDAAKRFVNSVGANKRCAVLEFSDAPQPASPFLNQKAQLRNIFAKITAQGETCLFDALYDAICTLEAEEQLRQADEARKDPKQKVLKARQAIVALTDGIDNKSRRRVEEIVQRAQEAGIKLFLLGFGRPGELDIPLMQKVAKQTRGEFYHADSEAKLIKLFEDISTKIYDDGIDELALRKLALETGGRYYPAEKVDELQFILEKVTHEINKNKEVVSKTFQSVRPVADGVPRKVRVYLDRLSVEVVDVGGRKVEKITKRETISSYDATVQRGGVVIAEMSPFVSLMLLAALAALIALPALLRRRSRV